MKWFTSDTHFNHQSMLLEDSCDRPFRNVWNMNACMIERWNEVVKKGDIVYHLGDFALPPKADGEPIDEIIKKLNGQIILVRGNHDHNVRKYEDMFAKVSDLEYIKGDGDDKKYRIMLCHYPMQTWRASCHGSWHLHGHSHGNLEPIGKRLDVSVDAHDFRPLSFNAVKEIIMARRACNEDEGQQKRSLQDIFTRGICPYYSIIWQNCGLPDVRMCTKAKQWKTCQSFINQEKK